MSGPTGHADPALLGGLLRDVSRSFYKTLAILPGSIRPQISLAYLLARTTDTIADTEIVPVELIIAYPDSSFFAVFPLLK